MKTSMPVNRGSCVLIIAALLISTHRLPAPISEIPQSPTPTPAVTEAVQPKKSAAKPKAKASPETAIKPQTKPTPPPLQTGAARFAGTWTGTINQGIFGNIEISLAINATGTSVKESSKGGTFTHPATINGNMMTWKAGWLSEIAWTFTPAGDGKTAAVTSKSGFGVNGAAIFQKQ